MLIGLHFDPGHWTFGLAVIYKEDRIWLAVLCFAISFGPDPRPNPDEEFLW